MAIDTAAIKKAVFRLLEEDEEFRYAIAAKLGLAEILDGLRSIRKREEEYDKKFYEILAELRGQRGSSRNMIVGRRSMIGSLIESWRP